MGSFTKTEGYKVKEEKSRKCNQKESMSYVNNWR